MTDEHDDAAAEAERNKHLGRKGRKPPPGFFDDSRPIWEAQPDEPPNAFAAFVLYRNAGPKDRSIRQVSAAKGSAHPMPAVRKWCSKWFWVHRCREYDNNREREIDAAGLDEAKEQRRRHVRLSVLMQDAGAARLLRAVEAVGPESELDGSTAVRAVVEGAKLERLATGGATARVEVQWEKLSDEQMLRIANGDNPDEVIRDGAPVGAPAKSEPPTAGVVH